MNILVAIVGAAGILLVASSFPPLAGRGLSRRIEPFLSGLAGKPSNLLVTPLPGRWRWAAGVVERLVPGDHIDLCRRLQAAGKPADPTSFRVEQVVWGAAAMATVFGLLSLGAISGFATFSPASVVVVGVMGVMGAPGRDWYLSKEIVRRQEALRRELPTVIDHMTLALLAGESVPAAFARVARAARGIAAEEFELVVADMRAGATVLESLDAFRSRLPDPAVARFVDAMCAAVERGTSLSDVLRAQADDVREARRRHLLELGGSREIWMLVPVVFLIMPVVVLFALYPGLVSLDLLVP